MPSRKKSKSRSGVVLSLESLRVSVIPHDNPNYFEPTDTGGFRRRFHGQKMFFRYFVKIWAYPEYRALEKGFDPEVVYDETIKNGPTEYIWDSPEPCDYHKGVDQAIKELIDNDLQAHCVINAETTVRAILRKF